MTASADNAKIITVVCPFCFRSPRHRADERQLSVEGEWLSTSGAELNRKYRATAIRQEHGRGGRIAPLKSTTGETFVAMNRVNVVPFTEVIPGGSAASMARAPDYETKRLVPFRNRRSIRRAAGTAAIRTWVFMMALLTYQAPFDRKTAKT